VPPNLKVVRIRANLGVPCEVYEFH